MVSDIGDLRDRDATYTEVESTFYYVQTSKTAGYIKLYLAPREFKKEHSKVRTYDV